MPLVLNTRFEPVELVDSVELSNRSEHSDTVEHTYLLEQINSVDPVKQKNCWQEPTFDQRRKLPPPPKIPPPPPPNIPLPPSMSPDEAEDKSTELTCLWCKKISKNGRYYVSPTDVTKVIGWGCFVCY
jgi:hypothetical protein